MSKALSFAGLTACVVLACLQLPVQAQDSGKSLEERIKDLERRVAELEAKLAEAEGVDTEAEAEELLGALRDTARIQYSKQGYAPTTFTGKDGCDVELEAYETDNYRAIDRIASTAKTGTVAVVPLRGNGRCAVMSFKWASGASETTWFDNKAELEAAYPDFKEAGPGADNDPWALYRKVGRSWTVKYVTKIEGLDDMVSYFKSEITEVNKDSATMKYWMLDKDKQPMAGVPASEMEIRFNEPVFEDPSAPQPELKHETIKVEAGEFECLVTESSGTTVWSSVTYPGLLVKFKNESTTGELVEFISGDDGAGAGDDADPFFLYRKVGRTWMWKNTTKIAGMDDMVSYNKNEVAEVTAEHAKVKMWILDKDKKPMAGLEEAMEYEVKFAVAEVPRDPEAPKIETKDETVTVEAGEFECTVHEVNGSKSWTSKKYPGLLVKMEHGSGSMELVEFKE